MSKVYWDNGEEITDAALLTFFTGSTTYDMMETELYQLKHEMTQDLADAGANDMLREELSQLQQTQVHQEDTNNNTSTEEVCWIGDGEPTEEQISFLTGGGANDMLRNELFQLQQTQLYQEDLCYSIDNQRMEANKNLEGVPSSFDPTPVDGVVSDEIVDSVVSQESNHATSAFNGDVSGIINSFLTKKELPNKSWIRNKLWHKICLEHDRYWVEDLREMNKAHPITLQMYDTINQSIDEIVASITRPSINDIAKELMKLYAGGWISDDQYYAVKKRCGIKAERPITSWVKSKKKKRKMKKKKPVDEDNKIEEQPVEDESLEEPSSNSLPPSPSTNQKFEVQVNIGRYLLGGRRKHKNKYAVISKPLKKSVSRKKEKISKEKVKNYYKNKASSRGLKLPFYRLSISSDTRRARSLKFKRRTFRKVLCNAIKWIRNLSGVKTKAFRNKRGPSDDNDIVPKVSSDSKVCFDETDADWDVLNEAIAIAKREAVELELMATKEREDEEETAPSDTTKYDPVKEALDFLNSSSVDQNKHIGISDNEESQPTLGLWNRGGNASSRKKSKRTIRQALCNQVSDICAYCGKESNSSDMNTCNKCKSVKYCNAACKKMHRQKHKKQCERVGIDVEASVDHVEQTNTEDSNDDIDALDSKVSSSGYDNDSKKKTAPNQEEQAAPMSTNIDLSIPGAFTQYLHGNSKSCCSDAGCSNFGRTNHEIDTLDTLSSSSSSGEESMLEGMKDDKSGADNNTGEYQANV